MLFNSWGYLLFLFIAFFLHWSLPHRWRMVLLAALSVLFYSMWRWQFSLLVIFSACVDYIAALRIQASADRRLRKQWLLVSLIINLGLLIGFKYTYFIYDNIRFVALAAGNPLQDLGLKILLPLGISFYTFQTISYTIDTYRGIIKPTKNFVTFLTYVSFWPQLVAGPVLRASEVIPELERKRTLSLPDVQSGVSRIIVGLFMKVVLADNLAFLVDRAFSANPIDLCASDVWVASFLFGFQIYFDFAGYSHIALGSARILGIHFPENFNWPYLATSPKAFWKRWHISMSSWIRDYLYLPLSRQAFQKHSIGGLAIASDRKEKVHAVALFLTWFIMGFWHGAGWNFALWGLYHALLVYLYRIIKPLRNLEKHVPLLAWMLMLSLAMLGWIPFRAHSLAQTKVMFSKLFMLDQYALGQWSLSVYSYAVVLALVAGTLLLHQLSKLERGTLTARRIVECVKAPALALMVFFILIYLRPIQQFIYFQF